MRNFRTFKKKENPPINEYIRADKVRLIDENGEQLGVVDFSYALNKAKNVSLDLVMVSPNAKPIVCKIMNYGKYRYEKQKKDQRNRKSQKVIKIKEIKLRPKIADNDYNTKVIHAKKFLSDKNKVKFNIFFRGREIGKRDMLNSLIDRLKTDLEEYGHMEGKMERQGRRMNFFFEPNK